MDEAGARWTTKRLVQRGFRATRWVLLLSFCGAAFALPALAQDRKDGPEYREAVDEALAEYAAQNFPEARTLFARAHSLYPNARTLRGLGAVSYELRQYSRCVLYLEQALRSNERPLDDVMRAEVTRLLSRARGFVGTLNVSASPDTVVVSIDGGELQSLTQEALQLDVGTHQLEFSAEGYASDRRSFTVEGGERETWRVALQRPAAQPTLLATKESEDATAATPPSHHSPAKFVALGVSIATGAVTALGVGMREARARELHRSCPAPSVICKDLQDSGKAWRGVAIVGGAITSALTVATIVLFARARPEREGSSVARALGQCELDLLNPGLSCKAHF